MLNENEHVGLSEAATLLGVSKATLRNWDKAGKLSAIRHPVNGYRLYSVRELKALQEQFGSPLLFTAPQHSNPATTDLRAVKRAIAKLHDVMRDADSHSNIIERFDELTKMTFSKIAADRGLITSQSPFERTGDVSPSAVKSFYSDLSKQYAEIIPERFASIRCSDAAIIRCCEILKTFDFQAAAFDFKGVAYEEVLRNTFDKGDHQQFFTPPHIVDFMVSICAPFMHGKVCDPAAGTGGFLAAVSRHNIAYGSLTAIEIDERLAWVAGINMLVHDATNIHTVFLPNGGTLGPDAAPLFGNFNAIVTNPPFGSDFTDRDSLETMGLGKSRPSRRRGILFIERCHALLAEGGVLGIIIDEGVLNLPHAEDVRRFITANFDIQAIVSLPETAFMPYASVNASILLLLKRSSTDNSRAVFFAKADAVGRKPNGDDDIHYHRDGRSYLESDFPHILEKWQEHLAGKSFESDKAYITDVMHNLAKYENGYRLDFQYHHPSRLHSEEMLNACTYPVTRLGDICAERNAKLVPSQELPDTILRYTGLANIEAGTGVAQQEAIPSNSLKSAVVRYEPGDIIFARMRPALRKVAFMNFEEGGYASPECSVLVVKPDDSGNPIIDPLLLSILLRSDFVFGQLTHLIAGIGRPRISAKELRGVRIPLVPRDEQIRLTEAYSRHASEARRLQEQAAAIQKQASDLLEASVTYVAEQFSAPAHKTTKK